MTPEEFSLVEDWFHRLVDQPLDERLDSLEQLQRDLPQVAREVELLLGADTYELPQGFSPSVPTLAAESDAQRKTDPPKNIGPYVLQERIGEGGMGVVWRAHQTEPVERDVALKVIAWGWDSRSVLARFVAEREALARMQHPNIATVFDAGTTEDGRPWFAMELIDGIAITEYCDDRRLDTRARLDLFVETCRAVQHAHRRGIIHRDLKPSNVMVTTVEGKPQVKIIDFGVAKAIEQPLAQARAFTVAGGIVGTPEYMSPEQAGLGKGQAVDTRTDVYSLGVLLHELLVGELPISAEELRGSALSQIGRVIGSFETPRPSSRVESSSEDVAGRRNTDVRSLARQLRGELDWIALKALAKNPDDRYESPADLADDIDRFREGDPVVAGPPSTLYRLRLLARKHRAAVATVALVALALVVGSALAVLGLLRARQAAEESRIAERESAQAARVSEEVTDFLTGLLAGADPFGQSSDMTARELLERGLERVDELEDEPLVHSRVLQTMGSVLTGLGDFERAREFLERSIEIVEREEDPDVLQLANVYERLGMLGTRIQDYEAALQAHEKVLSLREGTLGDDDPLERQDIAIALSNLAMAKNRVEGFASARPLFERALEISAVAAPDEPMSSASIRANLAVGAATSGDHATAVQQYEQVLDAFQREFGREHPNVAVVLNNLAYSLRALGRHAEAEEHQRRSLELDRAALGDEHPQIGTNLMNLSRSLMARGRLDEARAALDEAAVIVPAAFGADHQHVPTVLELRSSLELRLGDLAQARRFVQQAIDHRRRVAVPQLSGHLLWGLAQRARLQRLAGDLDAARTTCEEGLEHPDATRRNEAALCELQLAWMAQRRGDAEAAEAYVARAMARSERFRTDLVGPLSLAAYRLEEGDREAASLELRRSIEAGRGDSWIFENPDLAGLAELPENQDVVAQMMRDLGLD